MKFWILLSLMLSLNAFATEAFVEESRIEKARSANPAMVQRWQTELRSFAKDWKKVKDYTEAKQQVAEVAAWLWRKAKQDIHTKSDYDDRPLYWARLQLAQIIRSQSPKFELTSVQRTYLLEHLEVVSRGRHDIEFTSDAPLRILLTGFDPFLLDRNIQQGNPSGIAALLLDGQTITYGEVRAEIQTVVFPVRFKDFDEGTLEQLLAPIYALNSVDMVVTVSQGRSDFDLERFPGRRRSAKAPDNENIFATGTPELPTVPQVGRVGMLGPEFVEFSLPAERMRQAPGKYAIRDNRSVTTLEQGDWQASELHELYSMTAVQGGGGGYLSNEISYRSIRLRNLLGSTIPTGHIHTPILQRATEADARPIIDQLRGMLEQALGALR